MDLVDIDKVLDDLELNEDNGGGNCHRALEGPRARKEDTGAVNGAPAVTAEKVKLKTNVVNVSTVFNSLNEYVNAGGTELGGKGAGDSKPLLTPSTSSASSDARSSSAAASSVSSSPRTGSSPSSAVSSCSTGSSSSSTSTSDGEEERDARMPERRVNGPAHEKLPDEEEEEEEEDVSSLSANDYILDSSTNTTLATTNEDRQRKPVTAGGGENIDTSAFSYKNSLYSDTLSNDVINLEGISSISSIVAVDLTSGGVGLGLAENGKRAEEAPVAVAEDLDKETERAVKELGKQDEEEVRKPVIGFESTMDDVSDTELESYLQELEEYDVQQGSAVPVVAIAPPKPVPEPEPEPEPEPIIEPPRNDDLSIDSRSDDSNTGSSRGDNDEDLISQASTLEFNDLAMTAAAAAQAAAEIPEPDPADFPLEDGSEIKFIDCTETESGVRVVDDPIDTQRLETHPDRPTSLDLKPVSTSPPPSPTMEREKQSSPGHTPPSSASHGIDSDQGLTLSSTSSDDFVPSIAPQAATAEGAAAGIGDIGPVDDSQLTTLPSGPLLSQAQAQLGKIPPFWVPDRSTKFCMQCNQKFSVIKRRHHCRACGQLLCSSCCCLKAKLEYLGDVEARVCIECDMILGLQQMALEEQHLPAGGGSASTPSGRQPNPNNPMEYCSVIPPLQQAASNQPQSPISVMVPVGVLKRAGAPRTGRKDKNVIFSDGIRPGCDLTELDQNWDAVPPSHPSPPTDRKPRVQTPLGDDGPRAAQLASLIPPEEHKLPPVIKRLTKTETKYVDVENDASLIKTLREGTVTFALQRNFHVHVSIVQLSCCINRTVINFTTRGLHFVGQDEIVILLELDESQTVPKDIFLHLNEIYFEADRGNTITELGFSPARIPNFLGSKNHGGFLYVRPTYQCMQSVTVPEAPYLIGVLIHRWEVPWAKILPLRLMLRLGALYRYYPSPHVSVRERESVYVEIAQTIINLLADFRNFSYTIPTIRGMVIHIEDRKTSILIPRNRYDQIAKVVDGAGEQIMALGGNFSKVADGHLVCIQNTESGCPEATQYSTQAINIEGQPRKVTGASFLVLNGGLKPSSGLLGKCSIVEDGLMVQVPPVKLELIKEALKNMKDYQIVCGPAEGDDAQKEVVSIEWVENDLNFNVGVLSPIDRKPLNGVPSIRVHRGTDHSSANHVIRWTEVFIIQGDEESNHPGDPINMSKLSEQIAKSACTALVSLLDLLASNGFTKLGLRILLDSENVSFEAGSQGSKLAPLYMNALMNELLGTLNNQANALQLDQQIIIELIFHILDK